MENALQTRVAFKLVELDASSLISPLAVILQFLSQNSFRVFGFAFGPELAQHENTQYPSWSA
jgi:hypothetical protein